MNPGDAWDAGTDKVQAAGGTGGAHVLMTQLVRKELR